MPSVVRDGVRLHYNDTGGSGPCVVMTHGFGSGSSQFDPQVKDPAFSAFRVITWDLRAHAKSDSPDDPSQYSKDGQVRDLKAVLDAAGVKRAVFLGHSMGAYDTLLFHRCHPEYVRALVLCSSGPGFAKDKARLGWNERAEQMAARYDEKGLDGLVGADKKRGHRSAKGLALAARGFNAQRSDDPVYQRFSDGPFVVAKTLGSISVPTLVVLGERDKTFTAGSQMMAKKIPTARPLVVIPGAGHMVNESKASAGLFNEAVSAFLASLPPDQPRAKL
eukprot:TRINITY_DN2901_c0_g1_i1.p1 TRINITY_DN2901_c0_g1~~TRINITY_DN2901_c0_g1_i1.p1  ORF type:complete len:298 (+),score=100.82 TRINITY_DN2901_c0_g1_i1:68-895(+)